MQVDVEKLEAGKVRLNVTLTAEEVGAAIDGTYQRLGQRVRIPGFRPGKAPRAMLLRSYGEESFYHQATDDAVRKWYPKALDQSGIRPLDVGTLDLGDDHSHLTPGDTFTFAAEVPTLPEIELPDYGQIQIPAPSSDVSEADVDKLIDELRMATSTLEPAPAKAAAIGDVVKMNIHGRSEGREVLSDEDFEFALVEEDQDRDSNLPGLSKELVDSRPGDIREIVLSLGDDYRDEEMAGKALSLNIVVKEILRKVLPEVNDEWVVKVSGDAKTPDELRDRIRHNLEHEKRDEAINEVATQVIDSLIARTNPVVPEVMVNDELDTVMREQRRYFERRGLSFDQYLVAARKSEDEHREELRGTAERRVKRDLILDSVAAREGFEADPKDVDEQVNAMSKVASRSEADYERLSGSARLHDSIAEEIRRRMALTKLVEMASGLTPLHDETQEDETSAELDVPDGDASEVSAVARIDGSQEADEALVEEPA